MLDGWMVARSIALELDLALSAAADPTRASALPADLRTRLERLDGRWHEQARSWVCATHSPLVSQLGLFAQTQYGDDYAACTLPMRELTVDRALQWCHERAAQLAIDLDGANGVDDAAAALRRGVFALHGVAVPKTSSRTLSDVLRGGAHHEQFWHWVDQFYYTAYEPWRRTRAEELDAAQHRAVHRLGAAEAGSGAPAVDWAPAQAPLRTHAGLSQSGPPLRAVFWVQPLGIWDLWALWPGARGTDWVSCFVDPGEGYAAFRQHAEDVAERAKALGDPTRLLILRVIRELETDASQIAAMLDLARPTVSIHCKQLREAGLIESHKEGRRVVHAIRTADLRRLFEDLDTFLGLP